METRTSGYDGRLNPNMTYTVAGAGRARNIAGRNFHCINASRAALSNAGSLATARDVRDCTCLVDRHFEQQNRGRRVKRLWRIHRRNQSGRIGHVDATATARSLGGSPAVGPFKKRRGTIDGGNQHGSVHRRFLTFGARRLGQEQIAIERPRQASTGEYGGVLLRSTGRVTVTGPVDGGFDQNLSASHHSWAEESVVKRHSRFAEEQRPPPAAAPPAPSTTARPPQLRVRLQAGHDVHEDLVYRFSTSAGFPTAAVHAGGSLAGKDSSEALLISSTFDRFGSTGFTRPFRHASCDR